MSMESHKISEREIKLMPKWTPTEAFTDIRAMRIVIPLPIGTFNGAMTTRQQPDPANKQRAAKLLPRLPMKKVYAGPEPTPVVTFSDGAAWLRLVSELMPAGFELSLMQSACWRLSCRVSRGSRERTRLAKLAYAAYKVQWPDDFRVLRQPSILLEQAGA
jgi:hypothetical protein